MDETAGEEADITSSGGGGYRGGRDGGYEPRAVSGGGRYGGYGGSARAGGTDGDNFASGPRQDPLR